jgi:hypothetical protein
MSDINSNQERKALVRPHAHMSQHPTGECPSAWDANATLVMAKSEMLPRVS